MKLDKNKFYIKIIDLDETYKLLLEDLSIWNHLGKQISQIYYKKSFFVNGF
jgi:hypothetical protein